MVDATAVLKRLGIDPAAVVSGVHAGSRLEKPGGEVIESINPASGATLARVATGSKEDYDHCAQKASETFRAWRSLPAPARGEVVRRITETLRLHKEDLGMLVTLEVGKIRSEGLGEVQEMIDMGEFAVGLSRQLYGLTIASERPDHRMMEQWHPLGPVGVITAFNFPVAVWAWNAMIAAVCGDTLIWKPSPLTPLTAIAVQNLVDRVVEPMGWSGVFNLCVGEAQTVGESMIADPRLPLISATGSCRMGRRVGAVVAGRLGRTILELGGNNAVILTPKANFDLATRAVLFAAVGTAGQRCTTLRRLIIHESIAEPFVARIARAFEGIVIGDPADERTLMGPLIRPQAVEAYRKALEAARAQGGDLVKGGRVLEDRPGFFVEPTIVRARPDMPIVGEETFAPILYVLTYREFDEALAIHNAVEQGLSSAIFTDDLLEAERFLGPEGSDCGIANVNIGTSGAEIGGAFGGEKATGGGREAGSDSWKAYMRRQTCTINRGKTLPLAQGVKFDLDDTGA
ncbi:Aldehyde Dehydrogenase [Isosphaera pallida ATCC 43644]|uniref:aldehyde dehydrogenase (NAD(+)) n=1 Tax=Isosphaera pallida (strain ATCC 43644 / DSM 9630 / IS1B) TaxID=575540 RepID=E8QXS6_ISOPI|nr:aldehyde dehydrogenase family protein [Isosphaera pallida]ADV64113.1 Aldehyde Dehydrogenase [Isosphaera pallida ATCC 43644]